MKRLSSPGVAPVGSDQWAVTGSGGQDNSPGQAAGASPLPASRGRQEEGSQSEWAWPASGLAALALSLGPWRRPGHRPSEAILGACVEAPGGPYKALPSSSVLSTPEVHPPSGLQLDLRPAEAPLLSAQLLRFNELMSGLGEPGRVVRSRAWGSSAFHVLI